MPLPKRKSYTSNDYWSLPEGQYAELIDGQLYDMAAYVVIGMDIILGVGYRCFRFVLSKVNAASICQRFYLQIVFIFVIHAIHKCELLCNPV